MALDFTSFEKALASLERALKRSQRSPDDEELRAAVIHSFEYTYELAVKMLRRQLVLEAPVTEQIESLSYKDLLRESAGYGLPIDFRRWVDFRESRNITSHTYDEEKAIDVLDAAIEFFSDACTLLQAMKERSHD